MPAQALKVQLEQLQQDPLPVAESRRRLALAAAQLVRSERRLRAAAADRDRLARRLDSAQTELQQAQRAATDSIATLRTDKVS